MLLTKPIKSIREPKDGLRISVMSRHTLNDGVTLDPEIDDSMYDEWFKELAPPETLVGAYYKDRISWNEFSEHYKAHLETELVQDMLKKVISLAKAQNVTLLCVEDIPVYCHRRLIAQKCHELDPDLEIDIQ